MRTIVYSALLACMAMAALPARADDASRLKAARELVQTSHASDNLRKLFPTLIPTCAGQNPFAQCRRPRLVMRQGWSVSLFQASQQWPTMSS